MEISLANSIKHVNYFTFNLCHFKTFHDFITLHNLSMQLAYMMTVYHNAPCVMELLGMFFAKFYDSIPLLGKYCLFQKSKLLLEM